MRKLFTLFIASFTIGVINSQSCLAPTALSVFNITTTGSSLTWTAGGTETVWNVVYGTAGFNQFAASSNTATNDTLAITGLSDNTTYEFYVQADCGSDTSAWAGPFSFTTPCGVYLAPYYETYDTTILPTCWEQSATSGSGWVFSGTPGYAAATAGDHTGNAGSFAWIDYSATDVGTILESPVIDVSSLTTPYLEFYFYSHNTDDNSLNILFVESWTGTAWNQIDSLQVDNGGWTHYGYDISLHTYGSSLTKVRFRGESGGASGDYYNDLLIDDFAVVESPTCFPPTALSAFNITTSSASLTWNPGGYETAWNIVNDTLGFNLYNGTSNAVTNDTLVLTGLSANTTYEFYVQSDCGSGDTTIWAGPFSFSTLPPPSCDYIINKDDSYGDGWNGASIDISVNGVITNIGLLSGFVGADTISTYMGDFITFTFNPGAYDNEISFNITDPIGASIGSFGPSPSAGLFLTDSSSNSICIRPNDDLGAINGSSSETSDCELSDYAIISIDIFNYGLASQSGFDVSYGINGGSPVIETVTDTVSYGDTLTYIFTQTADLSNDGVYIFGFKTELNTDQDSLNDDYYGYSIQNLINPAAPIGTGDTICENSGDTLMLTANSSVGNITWYNTIGGTAISTGDTLYSFVNTTTAYYAETQNLSNDTLSTTYATNNAHRGNMIDVKALSSDITIDSVDAHPQGNTEIAIYYKAGSYVGFEANSTAWTLIGLDSVTAQATGTPTPVAININTTIPAGQTYAFYITSTDLNVSLNYTNGTTTGAVLVSNSDLEVYQGIGLEYPYGNSFSPRNWNGTLHYSTVGCTSLTQIDAVVDPCTNIIEQGTINFAVYPNPNSGNFFISNNGDNENITIVITDIQGKEVYREASNFNSGSNKSIELNNVEAGLYLMSITTENGRQLMNIIIQ